MTNRYLDVADATTGGKMQSVPRRRFFKSVAKWDETYGRVRMEKDAVLYAGMNGVNGMRTTGGLTALMEAGGRSRQSHLDEDWEDGASV
jgi:histone deacetylase 1/2